MSQGEAHVSLTTLPRELVFTDCKVNTTSTFMRTQKVSDKLQTLPPQKQMYQMFHPGPSLAPRCLEGLGCLILYESNGLPEHCKNHRMYQNHDMLV